MSTQSLWDGPLHKRFRSKVAPQEGIFTLCPLGPELFSFKDSPAMKFFRNILLLQEISVLLWVFRNERIIYKNFSAFFSYSYLISIFMLSWGVFLRRSEPVTVIDFCLRLCLEPGSIRDKPLFTAEIFSIPLPLPLTVFFLNQNRYHYRLPRVPKILTAKPLFRNSNTVTVIVTAQAVLPPAALW